MGKILWCGMRASTAALPHTKDSGHWGKPAARVAAVKVALYHFLDDRSEKTVLSLEPGLIFLKERVKVMEEHPEEHGAFRMSGTVNSCHSKNIDSGNRPEYRNMPLRPHSLCNAAAASRPLLLKRSTEDDIG